MPGKFHGQRSLVGYSPWDCRESHRTEQLNFTYADDTTLKAESEELNSLLMKMKEESEKADINSTFKKIKIMASVLIT